MKILGIGGSNHDISFCYLHNGSIERATEEERISREKHGGGLKSLCFRGMDYCLGNTSPKELDLIVANDILTESTRENYCGLNMIKINHHLAHAASSYYTSGMNEAAILVLDGSGSTFFGLGETCSLGYASENEILFNKKFHSTSLGNFYSFMSYLNRFSFLQEGKTMGLAPYGKDTYVDFLSNYIEVEMPKKIKVNNISTQDIDIMDVDLFRQDKRDLFEVRADIAYATQAVFEKNVIKILTYLYETTNCKNLCFAGGAALNSVLNGKIKKHTGFENVFVFPGAGDSGTAIGAALYGYHQIYKKPLKYETIKHVFFGKPYSNDDALESLKAHSALTYREYEFDDVYRIVAEELTDGKTVGWFQDGAEFGPRALGNRGILADPHYCDMKDHINREIKFREDFRPFAPVVIKEKAPEYFLCDYKDNSFMLFVEQVQPRYRKQLPAITHVDGSARLQTVSKENNLKLYSLLLEVEKKNGIPILLNTSSNTIGEPIVETPKNAVDTFLRCGLDILVINNIIVRKRSDKAVLHKPDSQTRN